MRHLKPSSRLRWLAAAGLLFVLMLSQPAGAAPLTFTDASGTRVTLASPAQRVVSLVPAVTEIICRLGASQTLVGLTYHTTYPPVLAAKTKVGGFLAPSVQRIQDLDPDLVFVSSLHRQVRTALAGSGVALVELRADSLDDICRNIELIGAILDKKEEAARVVAEIKDQLGLISRKVARIPADKRQRVIRLMGQDQIMTPGQDSFQNDFIRAAGGIPPQWGQSGGAVPVSLDQWRRFNPEVIYTCGLDREATRQLLSAPGWREVDAVTNDRLFFFPCELTCRASVNAARFVSWLAASIYPQEFAAPQNLVRPEEIVGSRKLDLNLDYVRQARVVKSTILDFTHQTLLVDFTRPMAALSTLEGPRQGLAAVGNHFYPPPCWKLFPMGPEDILPKVCGVLGLDRATTALLITGADMDNLAVGRAEFEKMRAYALATAGVRANAGRMSADQGRYYEAGTINVIVLTSRRLSPRARARALISATEAKTAALQDLDVRSSYQPAEFQATGTGTDNLIVVEGAGAPLERTGGHTKMGELIARAVYQAVTEAVRRQNGLTSARDIFQRLAERRLTPYGLSRSTCRDDQAAGRLSAGLEKLLLEPKYAAFLESALALEDAWQRGLVSDLRAWAGSCRFVAQNLAGDRPVRLTGGSLSTPDAGPLNMALSALMNGLVSDLGLDESCGRAVIKGGECAE